MPASEPGRTLIAFSPPREQWLLDWIKIPGFGVSGDGMPSLDAKGQPLIWDSPYEDYAGHPRSAGTHATVLRLGRENNVPLMFSLAQLSYYHAKFLGDTGLQAMKVRGRMQGGHGRRHHDLRPRDRYRTRHLFERQQWSCHRPAFLMSLVNGAVVVKDSVVQKDVYPGQAIRFPVEEEGRFEPTSRQQWLNTYAIDNGGVRPTLVEDITDDEAFLGPVDPAPVQTATPAPAYKQQDWFARADGFDDSELFLCRVHGVLEDRATAERDWAEAVLARLGDDPERRYDPLSAN